MSRHFFFIVNPQAGARRTPPLQSRIRRILDRRNVSYHLRETTEPGEATRLARSVPDDVTHVVSVGGDGTLHEVVNGLMKSPASLGIIPTGSGNDFSNALGLPEDLEQAIDLLQHGQERTVDVGRFDGRYFLNGIGLGLDGAVAQQFDQAGRTLGGQGYKIAAVQEALSHEGFEVEITFPDDRFQGRLLSCSVSNGSIQGGGFVLAPDASLDDGLLDVQLVRYMSVVRRLLNGPRWFIGTQGRLRDVSMHQVHDLTIRTHNTVPMHLDGEPCQLEEGVYECSVDDRGLEVICS